MLSFTPQCFVETIVLGVCWEHWPPKEINNHTAKGDPVTYLQAGFTTVDHVLKILKRIEVISDGHIAMVHHKTDGLSHQRKLLRHCGVTYGSQYVTNNDSWLLCRSGKKRGNAIDLRTLVRTQQLTMLDKGVALVPSLEQKYATEFTKDAYLHAAAQFRAEFTTDAARIATIKRYRLRTAQQLKED